ncbi:hypothetical protein [Pseudalkalibacillus hwajinpoensis]|uniref:Uncharacterized protein n=1 Tax=Guptibacillus hwajinpoensis TaxID=208199 RepID=A0A4U1MF41_9BACL|nr:hypothetical protein [Pseudalkalibacillus hwajinpoensis]TKD69397.1 hypothetical protein FBF83_15530 [Pseudalkalibacillus hwajinpoensis]
MKIRTNQDYFNNVSENAARTFTELPDPLPWIEPSINMLYLNAASSILFENYFAAISTTGITLEHVLRLAILEPDLNGLKREMSNNQLNKYQSITSLLDAPNVRSIIPSKDDFEWWESIGKQMRNKSAHYLVPVLLKKFTKEDYHPGYVLTKEDGEPLDPILHDWGSFFHKSDKIIALKFFQEATSQLKNIISNTNWVSDESWWKSQKVQYDMFFNYNWSLENMKQSLENMYINFPRRKD